MQSPSILEAQKHFNHDSFVTNCIGVVFTTHTLTHKLCCFRGVYAKLYILAYCQKLKEYRQTPNVSMSLYLPQIVTSTSYGVMVLDRYITPLSPLSHLILMEWCVYNHQEWYPLNSERILHFSQCLKSVVRLLGCGLCLHHSNSVQHRRRNVFGLWIIQIGIQNVFEQLVYVKVGSRQRRTISKLLCDHRFRPREVCQKKLITYIPLQVPISYTYV